MCSSDLDEKNEKDITSGNVSFKLSSVGDDGYNRLSEELLNVVTKAYYETYEEMKSSWESMKKTDKVKTLFCCDNRYYINYNTDNKDTLKEVNLYADLIRSEEEETVSSLKIVPAKIVKYNVGLYLMAPQIVINQKFTSLNINVPSVSHHSDVPKQDDFNIQDVIDGEIGRAHV